MQVAPGARQSRVEQLGVATRVSIPSRLNAFVMLFLFAWLGGWTVGGLAAFRAVSSAFREGRTEWFIMFWLMAWTLGEVVVAWILLYMLGGAEVITVSPGSLTIRLAAFGLGRTWEYDSSQIRALRVVPNYVGPQRWSGSVAFDYGARTIKFARDIDEAEASMVVSDLVGSGFLPHLRTAATEGLR